MNEILLLGLTLFGLALILKLKWWSILSIALILLGSAFLLGKKKKAQLESEKHFYEVVNYLLNVLPAFAREGKIDLAIEAVQSAFPEGEMKHRLNTALLNSMNGYADCLKVIEGAYDCAYVRRVHQFMLHAEQYGGDRKGQVKLLLHACRQWKNRMELAMKERKAEYRNVVLSIVSSLLICGMIVNMPFVQLDLSHNLAVQIVSIVVVLLDALILLGAKRYLVVDWTRLGEPEKERDYAKEMERFRTYHAKKERKLSFLLAAPALVAAVALFVLQRYWMSFVVATLFLVFLNQHRIGHNLLKKRLEKQLRRDFPVWLLDLSLLLQGDNVQTSIEKSVEASPSSLRFELQQLLARLAISPESYEPYEAFLEGFQIPEIHSTMRLLYGMSLGNQDMSDGGIEELVASNDAMQDQAEREWMKDKNSGLYALFLAPLLTASLHLVTDMAVFMLVFLATASV